MRALYPDTDGVAKIGKYAVRVRAVGNRRAAIAAALVAHRIPGGLSRASAPALRSHLHQSVAADFAKNRVVDVAGWQLPLTEARVAALVYLTR